MSSNLTVPTIFLLNSAASVVCIQEIRPASHLGKPPGFQKEKPRREGKVGRVAARPPHVGSHIDGGGPKVEKRVHQDGSVPETSSIGMASVAVCCLELVASISMEVSASHSRRVSPLVPVLVFSVGRSRGDGRLGRHHWDSGRIHFAKLSGFRRRQGTRNSTS